MRKGSEMSLSMILMTVAGTVIAGLAVLWARLAVKGARIERDRVQEAHDALDAAGKRLAAARQANQQPIDPKQRKDFEGQP